MACLMLCDNCNLRHPKLVAFTNEHDELWLICQQCQPAVMDRAELWLIAERIGAST